MNTRHDNSSDCSWLAYKLSTALEFNFYELLVRYVAIMSQRIFFFFFLLKFKNVPPYAILVSLPRSPNKDGHLQSAGGAASKGPTASVAGLRNQAQRHMKTLSTGQQQAASQNLNPTHIKGKEVFPKSFQSRTICHMLCSVQVKHVLEI